MLDALFLTSEWVHSDAYSDEDEPHTTHHYFDSSWDLAQEMIQAAQPCKCTCDHSQHEMPASKGVSGSNSHEHVPCNIDLPMERNGYAGPLAVSTPAPANKGAVSSDSISETDSKAHPGSQASALQLLDDSADLMNQQPCIIEASPSPVVAMTLIGDDSASPVSERLILIMSQFSSLELPAKQLHTTGEFTDVSSNSYGDIMHSQLNALILQFEANWNTIPFMSCSTQDLDFQAMQSIVDQCNIIFDGISIDGIFNTDNPLAFAAGMKNNPDILSQGQMFKADDREKFIASQLPKIQGLVDADIFKFHSMSDLPPCT